MSRYNPDPISRKLWDIAWSFVLITIGVGLGYAWAYHHFN